MNNAWAEVRASIDAAKATRHAISSHANAMADLLLDSLESVNTNYLVRLKARLRRFDAKKKAWRP